MLEILFLDGFRLDGVRVRHAVAIFGEMPQRGVCCNLFVGKVDFGVVLGIGDVYPAGFGVFVGIGFHCGGCRHVESVGQAVANRPPAFFREIDAVITVGFRGIFFPASPEEQKETKEHTDTHRHGSFSFFSRI